MCERHGTRYSHMRKIVNEGLSCICPMCIFYQLSRVPKVRLEFGSSRKCRDIGRVVLTSSAKMSSGSGLQRTG
ncbi:hypothetical protein HID58_034783 [Brassica napus]|uniref:Uncharacterized protein n=1 Tax=Brassica napus TaxID=3708 RepID=A0ABQ8C310_BRANA|nr:hypothetical protein HID58_034783 [Brassica napus]